MITSSFVKSPVFVALQSFFLSPAMGGAEDLPHVLPALIGTEGFSLKADEVKKSAVALGGAEDLPHVLPALVGTEGFSLGAEAEDVSPAIPLAGGESPTALKPPYQGLLKTIPLAVDGAENSLPAMSLAEDVSPAIPSVGGEPQAVLAPSYKGLLKTTKNGRTSTFSLAADGAENALPAMAQAEDGSPAIPPAGGEPQAVLGPSYKGLLKTTKSRRTSTFSLAADGAKNSLPSIAQAEEVPPAIAPAGRESQAVPYKGLLKTTKSGRTFTKDTFDVFAALILSLKLGPHKGSGFFTHTYPHSFTTDEAVASLASLKISRVVKREPASIDPTKTQTTKECVTYSMTPVVAKAMCQCFMDVCLIKSAVNTTSFLFKDEWIYQLTPKGLHILHRFISRNNVNADHLRALFRSLPMCTSLLHLERQDEDDQMVLSEDVITEVFRLFAGDKPRHTNPVADKDLDPAQRHNKRTKGVPFFWVKSKGVVYDLCFTDRKSVV